MAEKKCSDEEFVSLFERFGATRVAKLLDVNVRNIFARRRYLESQLDRLIVAPDDALAKIDGYEKRYEMKIEDGSVLVFSDAHYWPDLVSTAHRGLVYVAKLLQPKVVIGNGDLFDGAKASRHAPTGWTRLPDTEDELAAVDERTSEIRAATPNSEFLWTRGNHDARFEMRLAENASHMAGVKGTRLSEHFPHWRMCVATWINDRVVVKHRYKGGVHATHNNTVYAGKTIITGHLHSLKVTPFDDYNGTRWGVDTGTLADPYGEQFNYDEDNPKNHRSGFIVLTFRGGRLLWPEIVNVVDKDHVGFRGELIKV